MNQVNQKKSFYHVDVIYVFCGCIFKTPFVTDGLDYSHFTERTEMQEEEPIIILESRKQWKQPQRSNHKTMLQI